jgi:Domain of unknown function (DUF4386)
MNDRTTARVVGVLFIAADVAGVLSLVLLQSIVGADNYLTQVSLSANRVATGALLGLAMGMSVVGIAVAIYSVLKRFSGRLALGYVAVRTMEGMVNVISAILVLVLLGVSRDFVNAGASAASLRVVGGVVLAGNNWVNYAILPIVFGLDALILNYLLYRARLVPRWLSVWGLGGAAVWLAAGVMVTYGLQPSATTGLALPIGLQEIALATWLIVKGFNTAALESREGKAGISAQRPARLASGA